MRFLEILLALALLQDPGGSATEFSRRIEREAAATKDAEVRGRLEKVRERLKERARTILGAVPAGDDRPVFMIHDISRLTAPILDQPFPAFWSDSPAPAPVAVEPGLGEEQIVDLIKERVSPGSWEGDQTMEKTPDMKLLIHAPPAIHHGTARMLELLDRETNRGWKASIAIFGLSVPRPAGFNPPSDGVLPEASDALLSKAVRDAGDIRALNSFEVAGRPLQLMSLFSGREVTFVAGYDKTGALTRKVLEGVCAELRVVSGGPEAFHISIRVGYRKILGIDEVTLAAGPVQTPRVVEVELPEEERRIPRGRRVLLGLLGPLPDEAKAGPYLAVVLRVDHAR